MNRSMKFTIGLLLILAFSGCGEAFRGQSSFDADSEFENEDLTGTLRGFDSSNSSSRDREILMSYQREFTLSRSEMKRLNDSFEAFDIVLSIESGNQARVRARMALGCGNGREFESTTSAGNLQAGQLVDLGRDGDYRVEVQCNKANCREMVAAIYKVSGSNRGMILMGLEVAGKTGDTQVLYKYRPVNLYPFFAQMEYEHVSKYEDEKSCSVVSDSSNENRNILDTLINGDEGDLLDLGKKYLLDLF